MRRLVTILASGAISILAVVVGGCGLVHDQALPQESANVEQELLHKTSLEAHGSVYVVTSSITLQSGASTGRHVHSGFESGYVLNGAVELMNDGQPIRYFSAGDSFVTYQNLPHIVTNSGTEPATILVTLVVDADEPTTLSYG